MHDSKAGYGLISVINHWVTGLLVIGLIIVGLTSAGLDYGPERIQLIGMHKAFGTIALILIAWRVFYRVRKGFPDPSPTHPSWQLKIAKLIHWFLLAAILLMPVSGVLWSLLGGRDISIFGLFAIPAIGDYESLSGPLGDFHRFFSKMLIAGIALHAGAAIYNAVTDTKNSAKRMILPNS